MSTIDLIVLGILKKEPMSAYDIQKLVEYRQISKWVKISTPSIYKKVIVLEQKKLIEGKVIKEGKMPEKVVYYLTNDGKNEFMKLMFSISDEPVNFFLDFNSVIVNLSSLSYKNQQICLNNIRNKVGIMKKQLQENLAEKNNKSDIPETGLEVLKQQLILTESIERWLNSLNKDFR